MQPRKVRVGARGANTVGPGSTPTVSLQLPAARACPHGHMPRVPAPCAIQSPRTHSIHPNPRPSQTRNARTLSCTVPATKRARPAVARPTSGSAASSGYVTPAARSGPPPPCSIDRFRRRHSARSVEPSPRPARPLRAPAPDDGHRSLSPDRADRPIVYATRQIVAGSSVPRRKAPSGSFSDSLAWSMQTVD